MRSFCIIIIFPLIFDLEFCFLIFFSKVNFYYFLYNFEQIDKKRISDYYLKKKYKFHFKKAIKKLRIIMKTKPSSANNKKTILPDKPQSLKKPTVVKCFICNQMFYSQESFDFHMDQHQKKVNKNFSDQIQRKTMESFGIKRNSSANKKIQKLSAISQHQIIKDKNNLNKTLKYSLPSLQISSTLYDSKLSQTKTSIMKKPLRKLDQVDKKQQKKQPSESHLRNELTPQKQFEQIDDALKESSLLMSRMTFLTDNFDHLHKQIESNEVQSDHESAQQEEQIQKTLSEHQFSQQLKNNNWPLKKIEEEILKTNFNSNNSLENCQIQIQFLRKLYKFSNDQRTLQKINKTKAKIVAQVIKIIMACQKSQFLTEPSHIKSNEIKEQQNHEARTCSECLDMIAFGQLCIIQGDLFFHKQCFP